MVGPHTCTPMESEGPDAGILSTAARLLDLLATPHTLCLTGIYYKSDRVQF